MFNVHPKNYEIEKLRAVAIIYVILWHYSEMLLAVLGIDQRYYGTWTGVDLFFCISGYVITKSLFASLGTEGIRDYLLGFYIKRVFRIWPSAFVCIGAALLVTFLCTKSMGLHFFYDTKKDALPALLNYANFAFFFKSENHGGTLLGIFWSLSLEEQFYLIIPIALWCFRRQLPAFMALLLVLALLQFIQHREPWKVLWWSIRTDGLIYGVLIAIIECRYNSFFQSVGRRISSFRPVIVLGLLPALLITLGLIGSVYFQRYIQLQTSWAGVISAILVFVAALDQGLVLSGTLVSPVLIWIGSRSFGIYLFHNLVLVIIKAINLSKFHVSFNLSSISYYLLVFVTIGCLGGLCELNYRLIEVPLRNLGRRIAGWHFSGTKEKS